MRLTRIAKIILVVSALAVVGLFQNCGSPLESATNASENNAGGANNGQVGNKAPTVNIMGFTPAAPYFQNAAIKVSATAADEDGDIIRVEFYVDGILAATDATAPYEYNISNFPIGNYVISVKSFDNSQGNSDEVTRSVSITNGLPIASITAPTNNMTVGIANIAVAANATDSDGQIVRVEFLVDNNLVGTDTSSPYTFTINTLAAGAHALRVRAVDNSGGVTLSANVNITAAVNVDPNADCGLASYVAPSFNVIPANLNLDVGLGPNSPAGQRVQNDLTFNLGSRKNNVDLTCNSASQDLSVNCNNSKVTVTPGNNFECPANRSIILTATIDDQCPNKQVRKTISVSVNSICPAEEVALPSSVQRQAAFGTQVALDGDYLAVGAPYQDVSAANANENTGAAFVFQRQSSGTWSQMAQLVPPGSSVNDEVVGVAIRGTSLLVGSQGGTGSVHLYERSGTVWNHITSVNSPGGANDKFYFGQRLMFISNTEFAVGAYGENTNGAIDAGAVYVYRRSGNSLSLVQKITASAPRATEFFGYSMSVSGSNLVIGAPVKPGFESAADNFGGVYLFAGAPGSYSQVRRISLANPSDDMQFGASVSTDGTRIAVGAPLRGNQRGAVYLYNMSGADIGTNPIQGSGIADNDEFGSRVKLVSGVLYASATLNSNKTGELFRFQVGSNGATQNYILRARQLTRASQAQFGFDFDISGSRIAVGSPGKSNAGLTNAGYTYIIGVPQ